MYWYVEHIYSKNNMIFNLIHPIFRVKRLNSINENIGNMFLTNSINLMISLIPAGNKSIPSAKS